ncbi:MAG: CvpA family protein [Clostridia bacterium]|nr:CvpA family protein [Clostridia bacterium]
MEPIKVEFSDKGKKKGVKGVVIPPDKAPLKIIINVVVMLLVGAVAYYFMLPPMNFHDYNFYIYWAIVLASYVGSAFITTKAFAKPEYVPYVRKQAVVPVILAGILGVVLLVGYLVSSPFFRAKDYSEILKIANADFSDSVSVIDSMSDFKNVALIDRHTAKAMADKTLGDFASLGLESQFEILDEDSTQINFKGSPYRIYPLKYGDLFKWFFNSVTGSDYEGIPGYVKVNLNTQQAELVTDYDIKYSTAEHFGEYLERVLRFRYPTYIFGEISFEVDDTGHPYWVVEHIKKTIGLVGGEDVQGILLVDAVTGESSYYDESTVKADGSDIAWIDQAYDADLLVKQYNYFGTYNGGFWNSLIGQSGVKHASDGYSFLALNDDVYLYTGVTSVTSDNSILGFFMINQRTKQAFFYNTTGATEAAAQKSAEGKVQAEKWIASFPILLNIDGEATYFMSLKDAADIVKSYALVNVEQYNTVAIPENKDVNLRNCLEQYIEEMAALSPSVIIHFDFDADLDIPSDTEEPGNVTSETKITGVVTDIRSAVVNGNTYYYLELDGNGTYYYIAATVLNQVVLVNVGDTITVTTDGGSGEGLQGAAAIAFGQSEPASPDEASTAVEEEPETVEETVSETAAEETAEAN